MVNLRLEVCLPHVDDEGIASAFMCTYCVDEGPRIKKVPASPVLIVVIVWVYSSGLGCVGLLVWIRLD